MIPNLQALKYFEAVAKMQHFTKAAQELYISQSTLSKTIDQLEREIGIPLFEKQGRNMRLTKYGVILRDYVQRGFQEMESGIQMIQSMADTHTGTICLASLFTMGAQFLPFLIRDFIAQYPKVNVRYYQKATTAILDQLVAGEIDLGFCGEFVATDEYACLSSEVVLSEELCLVVPEGHPLARQESVDFQDVLHETFIGYNEDTGIFRSIRRTLEQAGIHERIRFSFGATEDNTVTGLVRAGLGIGIIATTPTVNTDGLIKIKISASVK